MMQKWAQSKKTYLGKLFEFINSLLYWFLSLIIFMLFWNLFTIIPRFSIIPGPIEVIKEFAFLMTQGLMGVKLYEHIFASLVRVLLGFFYSFIIAVPLGLFTAYSKKVNKVMSPIIDLLRPIPPIAWIPFSIMVFGLTTMSHIFVIFTGAFFPLYQNTFDAIRGVKKVYKDVALSLGAKRSQIISGIVLPSIYPNIITGTRVSLGVAWMCVIAAEMIGVSSNKGIGLFIMNMLSMGRITSMLCGMIMIGIVGLFIAISLKALEKYTIKWRD
ncbi:MAG: ABC transporter permease [Promethearchaeota archaeon]